MRRSVPRPLLAAALALATVESASAGDRVPGFGAEASKRELEIEKELARLPSPEAARRWHRQLTAEPHPAGSERNNELAFLIAREWLNQGLEQVAVHRYDVLDTAPRTTRLEMVEPFHFVASLREEPYAVDPDSYNPDVSAAYSGLSASGEVTAPLVYAHSGNPEDYAHLRAQGIDVKGKVVLVRYSNPYSYRGFKALTAEREGAAAILIYSDPAEDGYVRGKTFPDGPWGPESHIQRGAITYDFMVPGDPLTPGWPSLADARRVPEEEARSLPRIVALPLSWKDAKPLLENLDGPVAPPEWQGGLPLQYRLGGGRVKVHVEVEMANAVRPNYVVEARIRGSERPDEWVVLGNHRDAWVFGGVDPSSGTASMLELTRALGTLLQRGIRPRRTLVFCSWDGEEVGLTGSTEWGEHFAEELKRKAVAYLNVDSSVSGPNLEATAVASFAPLVVDATRSLEDPSGEDLYDVWHASRKKAAPAGAHDPLGPLELVDVRIGSGSDHTVFLNHLGVPTVDLHFGGPYGVYHSMYDDFYWMSQFGDPGYRYHALMARLWGVIALRLANAELLPFRLAPYAEAIGRFVDELPQQPAAGRPDLAELGAALAGFGAVAARFDAAAAAALERGGIDAELARRVDAGLRQVERNFLDEDGLPGRSWFKHLLYAARYTYAHLELPGLTEAIEAGDAPAAAEQARRLARAVESNTALLYRLAAELEAVAEAAEPGEPLPLAGLEAAIQELRRRLPGEMAVYMKNLATGEELALDADATYETFSVIKIPIMAEVLRQAAEGRFALADRLPYRSEDARIPSGVLYALDPGLEPTVKDLVTLMIIVSDNAATDVLADKVGRDRVTQTMRELGLEHTALAFSDLDWDRKWLGSLDPEYLQASGDETLRFPFGRYGDQAVRAAFGRTIREAGIYFGRSTARETGRLLEGIARGEVVSEEASRLMREILGRQQVNDRFPRYLVDVGVAHKTGDGQPFIANDAGLLTIGDATVVLVVFTGHHRGTTPGLSDTVARVAALVARHYGGKLVEWYEPEPHAAP